MPGQSGASSFRQGHRLRWFWLRTVSEESFIVTFRAGGPEVAWRFVRWPPEEPANELRFTNRVQDGGHNPPGRNPDRQDEQPKAEHENRGKPLGHGGRQDE